MSTTNSILQGDCIETMKEIPDGTVDMVLGDLPYGTTSCKWDSVIDLEAFWKQVWRVAKPNAAIVLTAQGPFTMALGMSQIEQFKYKWVWRKPLATNFFNAKKQPLRCHEDMLVFYRKPCLYLPQKTQGEPYQRPPQSTTGECWGQRTPDYRCRSEDGSRYPVDVLEIISDRGLHPTQKPVALGRYMIRTYTKPGDLVLDPTCGSGSFCVAAKQEGRDYIGIEQDAGYVEVARERLRVEPEPTLFDAGLG